MITLTDQDGNKIPSRIWSYLAWRKVTKNFSTVPGKGNKPITREQFLRNIEEDVCPFCGNVPTHISNDGQVYCLCEVLDFEHEMFVRYRNIRSFHRPLSLSDFKPHGTFEAREEIKRIKTVFSDWIVNPSRWLVLTGKPGTGKSHLLEAAANIIGPMAVFLSTSDFESAIFNNLNTGTLVEYIDDVSRAPILLLDDLGADYGSDIVKQKMRALLNKRYMLYQNFPTALSTNLALSSVYVIDPRLEDRLREVSTVLDFNKIESFRRSVQR